MEIMEKVETELKIENQKLREQFECMAIKMGTIEKTTSKLKSENQSLQDQFRSTTTKIKLMEKIASEEKKIKSELKIENQKLQDQHKFTITKLEFLTEKTTAELRNDNKNIEEQLRTINSRMGLIEKNTFRYKSDNQILRDHTRSLTIRMGMVEHVASEIKFKIIPLQLESISLKIGLMEKTMSELKIDHKNLEETMARYMEKIDTAQKNTTTQNKVTFSKLKESLSQKILEEVTQKSQSLQNKIEILQLYHQDFEENRCYRADIKERLKLLEDGQQMLKDNSTVAQIVKDKNSLLENKHEELKEIVTAHFKDVIQNITPTRISVAAIKKNVKKLKVEKAVTDNALSKLQNKLSNEEKNYEELKNKMDENNIILQKQNICANQQVQSLQNDVNTLRLICEDLNKSNKIVQEKSLLFENKHKQLKEMVLEHHKYVIQKITPTQNIVTSIEEIVKKLEMKSTVTDEVVSQLKNKMDVNNTILQKQNINANQQVQSLQNNVNTLRLICKDQNKSNKIVQEKSLLLENKHEELKDMVQEHHKDVIRKIIHTRNSVTAIEGIVEKLKMKKTVTENADSHLQNKLSYSEKNYANLENKMDEHNMMLQMQNRKANLQIQSLQNDVNTLKLIKEEPNKSNCMDTEKHVTQIKEQILANVNTEVNCYMQDRVPMSEKNFAVLEKNVYKQIMMLEKKFKETTQKIEKMENQTIVSRMRYDESSTASYSRKNIRKPMELMENEQPENVIQNLRIAHKKLSRLEKRIEESQNHVEQQNQLSKKRHEKIEATCYKLNNELKVTAAKRSKVGQNATFDPRYEKLENMLKAQETTFNMELKQANKIITDTKDDVIRKLSVFVLKYTDRKMHEMGKNIFEKLIKTVYLDDLIKTLSDHERKIVSINMQINDVVSRRQAFGVKGKNIKEQFAEMEYRVIKHQFDVFKQQQLRLTEFEEKRTKQYTNLETHLTETIDDTIDQIFHRHAVGKQREMTKIKMELTTLAQRQTKMETTFKKNGIVIDSEPTTTVAIVSRSSERKAKKTKQHHETVGCRLCRNDVCDKTFMCVFCNTILCERCQARHNGRHCILRMPLCLKSKSDEIFKYVKGLGIKPMHQGTFLCPICNDVSTFRYMCLVCPDYYHCLTCERRQLHSNHCVMRAPICNESAQYVRKLLEAREIVQKYYRDNLILQIQTHCKTEEIKIAD